MFMHFIKSINWVDILILCILVRMVYISLQTGFVVELTKLVGAVLTVFVCFHYYTPLALLLQKKTHLSLPVFSIIVFVILWAVLLLICKLLRDGLFLLFTIQALTSLDRWGAAVLSVGRFSLAASMVMFLFLVTGNKYLENVTARSVAHKYLLSAAPKVYHTLTDKLVARLFSGQQMNKAVDEELNKVAMHK